MREILGVKIAASNYGWAAEKIVAWGQRGESRAVIFANVHVLMEAFDDATFRAKLNAADMVNPDGMPLVWALRAMGERDATRVYGPDATEVLLQAAQDSGTPVGFYGGNEATLTRLVAEVRRRYPELEIAFTMSPPFRPLEAAKMKRSQDGFVPRAFVCCLSALDVRSKSIGLWRTTVEFLP